MKITPSKLYIASFGRTNKKIADKKTQNPKDTLEKQVENAFKAIRTILNPPKAAKLTCKIKPNGEKHVVVSQNGEIISLSKFAKDSTIPFEIAEGFDKEKNLINKKTIYDPRGNIDAVLYGIHTDTSNIDKRVLFDKYGISQFVFENIDNQKGTIDKITELYYDGTPSAICYNLDMKNGITRRKELYYEDGKTLKILQEDAKENSETGLIELGKETHFRKNGHKCFVYENIREVESGECKIGKIYAYDTDGETLIEMYEKAIQLNGNITEYKKLTQFEVRNGILYEVITTKTEEGYETKEQKVVLN